MPSSYLVAGARTPIGKLSGALASFTGAELGGLAITAALERAGVAPTDVDYTYMGQVLQAGTGQMTARQAANYAGIPLVKPSTTINKVCLSGLNTIYLANQMIAAGEADIVVAGGMESMSNAPFMLPKARTGYRYGHGELLDAVMHDGLFCALDCVLMGEGTERYAASAEIDRGPQDELAAASHQRASKATKDGLLAQEIVPVTVPQRRGDAIVVTEDQGIRDGIDAAGLSKLAPAFTEGGNITAGNASQLSDGASATVIASPAAVERLGLEPLAEFVSYGQIAGADASLLTRPSEAIFAALERIDGSVGDIDLFELNEAFAAVGLASMDHLGISDDVVNVNGGAIAVGHPIGATGNRLALTMAHELKRRGGGTGAAALCGGGGQGDALILRVS